jgi:hypothetical protein
LAPEKASLFLAKTFLALTKADLPCAAAYVATCATDSLLENALVEIADSLLFSSGICGATSLCASAPLAPAVADSFLAETFLALTTADLLSPAACVEISATDSLLEDALVESTLDFLRHLWIHPALPFLHSRSFLFMAPALMAPLPAFVLHSA